MQPVKRLKRTVSPDLEREFREYRNDSSGKKFHWINWNNSNSTRMSQEISLIIVKN